MFRIKMIQLTLPVSQALKIRVLLAATATVMTVAATPPTLFCVRQTVFVVTDGVMMGILVRLMFVVCNSPNIQC